MKEYSEMPEPRCRSQLQQTIRLVFMGIYIFCLATVAFWRLVDIQLFL